MENDEETLVITFGTLYLKSGNTIPYAARELKVTADWTGNSFSIETISKNFVTAIHPKYECLIGTVNFLDPTQIESFTTEYVLTVKDEDRQDYIKKLHRLVRVNYINEEKG